MIGEKSIVVVAFFSKRYFHMINCSFRYKHDIIYEPCLFTLCVFLCAQWFPTHTVMCFLFCLSSSCVPLCYRFLWIYHFLLSLRFSLTFISLITNILKGRSVKTTSVCIMLIIFWLLNIFNILKSCINVCVCYAIIPYFVYIKMMQFILHWFFLSSQNSIDWIFLAIYGQLPIYRFYGNRLCWATARKCNSESANFTEDTIDMIRTALVFASFRKIVSCFGDFLHCSINKIYVQCRKI
jgi:hypothetical protein